MPAMFAPDQILKANTSDLLDDLDLTTDELVYLLDLAAEVKAAPSEYAGALEGKNIAMLFEKPSLRTKLTFELAMKQLGGGNVFIEGPIGVREPLKDVARNLDRWVNGIVARVFLQTTVEGLAHWSRVPVINALSDLYHPCQALADMQTIREHFGELRGLKLAFIGDGNNVAQSLMLCSLRLGMDFALGCPEGYLPESGNRHPGRGSGGGHRRPPHHHSRQRRRRQWRARHLHRRVDQHGAGAGSRGAPARLPRLPGQ